MSKWSVGKIQEFYTYLNEYFKLSVNPEFETDEKHALPIRWHKGKIAIVSDFLNDEELEDNVRINLLILMYSAFYQTKHNDNHIGIHPMFMKKGICEELKIPFLSDEQIERNLRKVRRKLYDEVEYCSYFKVGYELRESAFSSYEVTKIERNENDIFVTVKPIGCKLGNPEKIFTEEELYKRCCAYPPIDKVKVDMRNNLIVISGPSGVGKTTIVKELMKQFSELNRTVSVTTRKPRDNEVNGKDYYFISLDQFFDYQLNDELLENTIYNSEHYGTLISEIDKFPTDKPLALVIDIGGRRSVLRHFPLSTSIFIQAQSSEELEKRIRERGANTETEIIERINKSFKEIEDAKYYDYIVCNENITQCVGEIKNIIEKLF